MLLKIFFCKMALLFTCLAIFNKTILLAAYPGSSFQLEKIYLEEKVPEISNKNWQQNFSPLATLPLLSSSSFLQGREPIVDKLSYRGSSSFSRDYASPSSCWSTSSCNISAYEKQTYESSSSCQFSQFGYLRGAHTWGKGIGIREPFSTLTATFAPLVLYHDYYPFLDLRAHYTQHNKRWAANVGGGLRWRDCTANFIFGAHLYYDYQRSAQMDFNQWGFGLEFFTPCFEMRLNAYFPIEDGHHSDKPVYEYEELAATIKSLAEVTQKGVDLEIGHTFWKNPYFSLLGAVGGYYYTDVCAHHHSLHSHKKRWGEKARACLNLGSLFTLQVKFYHDQFHHTFWQGMAMLSLPLDVCFKAATQENNRRIFTQPVERNEMIVKRRLYK